NTGLASLLVKSATTYAFTGSEAAVNAVHVPSSGGNVDAQFSVWLDGNNFVEWTYETGYLYAYSVVGGVTTQRVRLTYSATNHAWWRIREMDGLIYWETSSD